MTQVVDRILAVSPGRWTLLALFALAIAATRGHTLPPTVIVSLAAVTLWLAGRAAPSAPTPTVAATRSGIGVWATLLLAFSLWELVAVLLGNNADYPTFSMLVSPAMSWPPSRAAAGAGWLAWGWYLVGR